MTVYLVSYDLRAQEKAYDDLITYLKTFENWWHHLGSTWVIITDLTATQLRDGIRQHVDSNDKVLVVKSGSVGAWMGFNERASKWLKNNL